jgi:hypothetical protein
VTEAQQNRPASVAEKRSIFEHHLRGFLGARRLDKIDVGVVQGLKAAMNAGGNRYGKPLALKTRNNVLLTLGRRRSVHLGVTEHPTSASTAQRIAEADR